MRCEAPTYDLTWIEHYRSSNRVEPNDRVRLSTPRSVAPPIRLNDNDANSLSYAIKRMFEKPSMSAVRMFENEIESIAKATNIDSNIIKAIMHKETISGWYDAPLAEFGLNKSILPMNINVKYWGDTFGSRDQLKDPRTNIAAGAEMIGRIMANLPPGAPVSHIATLYNYSKATEVSEYGREVAEFYRSQPWRERTFYDLYEQVDTLK